MRINNIRNEIQNFLKEFCMMVNDDDENWWNEERMMDDHKCIEYENQKYYIPKDCSLMDEDDLLLKEMLIATFNYE